MSRQGAGILANSVLMAVGFAVAGGLTLLTELALVAGYGLEGHAQVTLALSVAILGAILCDLGLASKAGVRMIAQLRETGDPGLGEAVARLLFILLAAALSLSAVVWLGLGGLAARLGIDGPVWGHVACWLTAGALVRAGVMVFIGFERMAYVAVLTVFWEVVRLLWVCACLWMGWGVQGLYWGWSVAWSSCAALGLALAWRLVRRGGGKPRLVGTKRLLHDAVRGLPYLVPMLSAQALAPLTFLLVGALLAARGTGEESVSVLKICFSLAVTMRVVSQAIATSLFPVVARRSVRAATGEGGAVPIDMGLRVVVGDAVRVLAVVASGMLVGFVVLGGLGLSWLDALGDGQGAYAAGLSALLLLTLAIGADCYRVQIDQLLMGSGRPTGVAVGEALKLGALLMLIPWVLRVWPGHAVLAVSGAVLVGLLGSAVGRGVWGWFRLGTAAAGPAWRGLAVMLAVVAGYALGGGPVVVVLAWGIGLYGLGLVQHSDIARLRRRDRGGRA